MHKSDRTNTMRTIALNKQRIRPSSNHLTPHISSVTASAPRQCQRRVKLGLKPAFIPQHAHLLPPSQSHSQSASPTLDVRTTCSCAALPPSPSQPSPAHLILSIISSTCGINWPSPGGALRGAHTPVPILEVCMRIFVPVPASISISISCRHHKLVVSDPSPKLERRKKAYQTRRKKEKKVKKNYCIRSRNMIHRRLIPHRPYIPSPTPLEMQIQSAHRVLSSLNPSHSPALELGKRGTGDQSSLR